MSRRKEVTSGNSPVTRYYDDSRIMRSHETMGNFMMGGHPYLGPFGYSPFGLDFFSRLSSHLYNDFSSDDDDDDYEYYEPRRATNYQLRPHPRIRQLTQEEADKHAQELIEEEERQKKKIEKKKQKKLRKKERKRLEKAKALKDVTPTEEQFVNQEENPVIESDDEENKSNEAAGCDDDDAGENTLASEESHLNNSFPSNPEPEEPQTRRPAAEGGGDKSKLIQQPKEEEVKIVQKTETVKKEEKEEKREKEEKEEKEEKQENVEEKTPEEYIIKSRELADFGNSFAARGQYQAAVMIFTDAIKYNPKEFKLFGNRSLCYERMQQYEKALQDAEIAISMEPDWVKGLFRKGKALCGLQRYYDATLVYNKVLKLEPSNREVAQELKRTQTLHLMEMGFSQEQSCAALTAHRTLEGALDALFGGEGLPVAEGEVTEQPAAWEEEEEEKEEDDDDEGWEVQTGRNRAQQVKEAERRSRANSLSPTPGTRNSGKPPLYSVWVGTLAPTVTYANLYDLFSRAGKVSGVKMLLDQQCAFVNFVRREDCDKAVECFDGMLLEGAPLVVQLASRLQSGLGGCVTAGSSYKRECFFWRTTGCTRQDCNFRHVAEHKHIDRGRFTNRLGVNRT